MCDNQCCQVTIPSFSICIINLVIIDHISVKSPMRNSEVLIIQPTVREPAPLRT